MLDPIIATQIGETPGTLEIPVELCPCVVEWLYCLVEDGRKYTVAKVLSFGTPERRVWLYPKGNAMAYATCEVLRSAP